MSKPDQSQMNFSGGVQSQTNTGTAGGTMYYINLGGIKLLWGITASQNSSTAGPQYSVNFPSSFFSSLQMYICGEANATVTNDHHYTIAGTPSTTGMTLDFYSSANATGMGVYFIIGT